MMVYSVWQTPQNGGKYGIETLLIETLTRQEADNIASRYRSYGYTVRVAGPHEPQTEDVTIIDNTQDVEFFQY